MVHLVGLSLIKAIFFRAAVGFLKISVRDLGVLFLGLNAYCSKCFFRVLVH